MLGSRLTSRWVAFSAAIFVVVAIYVYPSIKARVQLGDSPLPAMFAPDLSMYLNLSQIRSAGDGRIWNPYYRIPVPTDGAGYLKFRLAPGLFGRLNKLLGSRTWLSLLLWNAFWWTSLAIASVWLFARFLPLQSTPVVMMGVGLTLVFNFGVLKSLLLAWIHLPSLAGFTPLSLPFMRAFIPVIPCVAMLVYLGLQMEALRRRSVIPWAVMATLQLFALAVFPYATVMMVGITGVSVLRQMMRLGVHETWRIPLVYAIACALLDLAFLWNGSVGYYDNRSAAIHFQPQLLPHLIGGNWLLIVAMTVAVIFAKPLSFDVKWPLAGLGFTNALLMLGDAIVPSTRLLLSHHAAHFVHLTLATLAVFVMAAALKALPDRRYVGLVPVFLLALITLNGVLLSRGNYRGFIQQNEDMVQISRLQPVFNSGDSELLIARSTTVDDSCGWLALLSTSPVLFCTDAEVMLTPQQNRDIHRFRQAIYLYLTGESRDRLRQTLAAGDTSNVIWRLGYWAEAISWSGEERQQGIQAIESDIIPQLERVDNRDVEVVNFFRNFHRIVVVDTQRNSTFVPDRLASFLKLEGQQVSNNFVLSFYTPR